MIVTSSSLAGTLAYQSELDDCSLIEPRRYPGQPFQPQRAGVAPASDPPGAGPERGGWGNSNGGCLSSAINVNSDDDLQEVRCSCALVHEAPTCCRLCGYRHRPPWRRKGKMHCEPIRKCNRWGASCTQLYATQWLVFAAGCGTVDAGLRWGGCAPSSTAGIGRSRSPRRGRSKPGRGTKVGAIASCTATARSAPMVGRVHTTKAPR